MTRRSSRRGTATASSSTTPTGRTWGSAGLRATGLSPDGSLVEIMEMDGHDFMVGVQFHPEFLSRPGRPHPLFREFVGVAMDTLREGGQHEMPFNEEEDAPVESGLAKSRVVA